MELPNRFPGCAPREEYGEYRSPSWRFRDVDRSRSAAGESVPLTRSEGGRSVLPPPERPSDIGVRLFRDREEAFAWSITLLPLEELAYRLFFSPFCLSFSFSLSFSFLICPVANGGLWASKVERNHCCQLCSIMHL